jgi:ubiquinol-cytochrome c reductase cytochrome c1 subunit
MVPFYGAGGDIDQEIADMVVFLQSISIKEEDVTPKLAFENACGRCHALEYEKWTQIGTHVNFKDKKDDLAYQINFIKYKESMSKFMGKLPPDLSMYIRSRGENFLHTFIESPQSHLPGTSMPRVGVTEETANKVIEYLKDAGDTKREEREEIGKYVMIYIVIFAIFAILWKRQVWKELH